MRKIVILLLIWASVTMPVAATEIAPVDRLINVLESIKSLHASFEQTGQTEPQSGEFWLQKPNQFRVESAAPLSQTIVSDGQSLWTHDRDLDQVIISDLQPGSEDIPLLLFAGEPDQIRQRYGVEFFEDEQHQYFVLTPTTDNGMVTGVALAFSENLPVRLSFENAMQDRTVINFFNVTQDNESGAPFQFEIPDFVDVIDDRQQR